MQKIGGTGSRPRNYAFGFSTSVPSSQLLPFPLSWHGLSLACFLRRPGVADV